MPGRHSTHSGCIVTSPAPYDCTTLYDSVRLQDELKHGFGPMFTEVLTTVRLYTPSGRGASRHCPRLWLFESGRGLPHSKTCRNYRDFPCARSVVERGSLLPLSDVDAVAVSRCTHCYLARCANAPGSARLLGRHEAVEDCRL